MILVFKYDVHWNTNVADNADRVKLKDTITIGNCVCFNL